MPSACMSTAWTNVHDPTIWSFRDFCWAIPLPGNANPNAVIKDRLRMLREFMVSSQSRVDTRDSVQFGWLRSNMRPPMAPTLPLK